MPSNPLALGIDFGGTGIKLGLIDEGGRLLRTLRFPTPANPNPIDTVALIVTEARILLQSAGKRKVVGIGVGAAGDIDPDSGVVRISPNLGWRDVPLKQLLARHLDLPIAVENDANVAALAAYVVEAKRKVKNLLCVTLGTGVGGGIILDGKLYRGTTGSAGELGHMTLYPEGIQCSCGNKGCLERYVGAKAMTEEAKRAIAAGEKTSLSSLIAKDPSLLTPFLIQKAARRGDKLASSLWQLAGEHLGIGLASLINVLNPEWIVLSGGLSRARNLLTDPAKRTILKRSFATPAAKVKLVISTLDQDLGIVGAGLVAHEARR